MCCLFCTDNENSSTDDEDNKSSEGCEPPKKRKKITSGEQAHISDESDTESELYSSEDDFWVSNSSDESDDSLDFA